MAASKTTKRIVSRYDLTGAVDLGQLGKPAHSPNVSTATVAVDDPKPDPNKAAGQRVLARVNRRVDILEWERSHDRLSDDAYREGRIAQAIFERAGVAGGGSAWREGSRVDAEIAKELAVLRHIATAKLTDEYVAFLRRALGTIDAKIVRQVLGENRNYADVELPRRRLTSREPGGTRRTNYVAQRFRDALETLAAAAARKRKNR